jgi:protein gp37
MKNTEINWTEHTFNPWWGCVKVSPACDNCYAEAQSKRFGHDVWGKDADRRRMSDKQWGEPIKWNSEAKDCGEHHRVFCASMADVFERREDLEPDRARLWKLIESTPNLDWLLLTKRHDNVKLPWANGTPWPNVWVGMSVENQQYADIRLPYLRKVNAVVKFVSAEPLLGKVDLRLDEGGIHWVIVGGESGPKSRAMESDWVKDIFHQCREHKIPFHFKQWGEWGPINHVRVPAELVTIQGQARAASNMPVSQFHEDGDWFVRQGKKANENRLDRELYLERPSPRRQTEVEKARSSGEQE